VKRPLSQADALLARARRLQRGCMRGTRGVLRNIQKSGIPDPNGNISVQKERRQ
jgi:hypothetical protein